MTRTAIITGLPGSDIATYLNSEREIIISEKLVELSDDLMNRGVKGKEKKQEMERKRRNIEDKVKIYNISREMEKAASDMNLSYDFRHIGELDREKRNMLMRLACHEVERKINRTEKPEVAMIKVHSTFYETRRRQFTRAVSHKDFRDLPIDRVCCIIDDEMMVKRGLQEYAPFREIDFSAEEVLHWVSLEIEASEDLFDRLGTKKRWNDRMQVFSRHMSTTSLYKFLMFEDIPVIYAVYPMTAVNGDKKIEGEIEKGIMLMNEYGIVKNPRGGDISDEGELICGAIDRAKASRDSVARAIHCVNRDIRYLVGKADIIFGNYPLNTYSDGMTTEMWEGMNATKLTLMKVDKDAKEYASPFRTISARVISRTYRGIENALKKEGYQPRFRQLMKRWEKEYMDMGR